VHPQSRAPVLSVLRDADFRSTVTALGVLNNTLGKMLGSLMGGVLLETVNALVGLLLLAPAMALTPLVWQRIPQPSLMGTADKSVSRQRGV
jgi:hypothetical protein